MREVDLDRDIRRYRHLATVALLLIGACHYDTDNADGAFYNWDARKVHCAIDVDDFARNDLASIEAGMDRAVERGEVFELYAHDPGRTVGLDKLEHVLAAARDRNLTFYTYDGLDDAQRLPGILLSFDDASIASWVAALPLFAEYNARVTFFVAYFPQLSAAQIDGLHQLADAGHSIQPHSVHHLRAPLYVEQKGIDAYLRDEALPSIDALVEAGFGNPTAYAYPYGSRTSELDDALLHHVGTVRSVTFPWSGVADPCPQ